MKRVYIAATLLLMIFSICTFEQVHARAVYNNIGAKLDAAEEYLSQDDYDSAYRVCCELDEYYQKEYECLSLMLYNHTLDEFNISIHELKALAKNRDKTIKNKLLTIRIQAEQLKKNQEISLENVL